MAKNWKLKTRPNIKRIAARWRVGQNLFLDKLGDLVIEATEQQIDAWEHDPKFIKNISGSKLKVTVNEEDEAGRIFIWQNFGTGIHPPGGKGAYDIEAKQASALRFTVGSTPKKKGGSGKGGTVIFARKIEDHPGSEAQRFDLKAKKAIRVPSIKLFSKIFFKSMLGIRSKI